ncbi:hypothetical protein MWU78_01785 [Arenibacter sp. F26102]|uniref:hypothetical protein n=1 Tax=Arenibacter sp. F26102 TaxID=2926416 RepID=UPI001FF1581B|nr:hypothetical protein [Arenibacter sp. F26102]MCK0144377.1 hypothetical protein [Arenibacter sp. F26102]
MQFLKLYLPLLLFFSISTYSQLTGKGAISLSELDIEKPEQPWWSVQKNKVITVVPNQIVGESFKDGILLIIKWFTIENSESKSIVLNNFKSENLALVEAESAVEKLKFWEMPFFSYYKQRKGLYTNAMYSLIAPWTTENPLFLHLTTTDDCKVKAAIHQCAKMSYEMVIHSFGSGLYMKDLSDININLRAWRIIPIPRVENSVGIPFYPADGSVRR